MSTGWTSFTARLGNLEPRIYCCSTASPASSHMFRDIIPRLADRFHILTAPTSRASAARRCRLGTSSSTRSTIPPGLGVTVQGPECPGPLGVAALGLASAVVAVHLWSVQFGTPGSWSGLRRVPAGRRSGWPAGGGLAGGVRAVVRGAIRSRPLPRSLEGSSAALGPPRGIVPWHIHLANVSSS